MAKLTLLVASLISLSSAFVVSPRRSMRVTTQKAELNGWVPDESKFAWGLPGSLDPVPEFDPFGFAQDCSLEEMKRYREAEVTHGRVSMLAVIGFLTAEAYHPLFNSIGGPAIRHLDQVRSVAPSFFELLAIVIGVVELRRAQTGWVSTGMKL